MKITAAEALAYVKLYGCTTDFPAVSDGDAAVVISGTKCADSYGRGTDHADYEESYLIELAVKRIWELKASRAAGLHDMQAGDQNLSRSQIGAKCLEQANIWARKIVSSTRMNGRYNPRRGFTSTGLLRTQADIIGGGLDEID